MAPDKTRAGSSAGKAAVLLPVSLSWTLLLYAALVLATGWAYSALRIRTDREQTLQSEGNRLQAVALALETGAQAMLLDGIGAATGADEEVAARGTLDALPVADLTTIVGKSLAGGEQLRAVFLADAGRFFEVERGAPVLSGAATPAWFTAASSPGGSAVWVGKPVPDPQHPGGTLLPIARRLHPAGQPEQWAGGLFSFRLFEGLRTKLGDPDGVIGLLTTDGTLLVGMQNPAAPRLVVGLNYAGSPAFKLAPLNVNSGVVEAESPVYGRRMMWAYERLSGYPLTVITGRPLDPILAPWRDRMLTTLLVAAASTALVLAMTVLLAHSVRGLRRRELHYRTLFNNARFSVFLLEGEHFVACNETAVSMFGLPDQAAVVGLTPWELSPETQPDGQVSQQAARERIAEALRRGGTTFSWQYRRLASGEEFPAEVDLSSLSTERTNLSLAVVHDLSARAAAEAARLESEYRYRVLVDGLPEAVFVHRGGEVLFANDAALHLVGASTRAELVGRSVMSFADPAYREMLEQRTQLLLEEGTQAEPREARVRRLDGGVIWVEVKGVRVQFAGAPAVQSVMRDITASKRRQQAENERVQRMQRQSAALLRLASDHGAWSSLSAALAAICSSAAEVLGADRVAIWLVDAEAAKLRCVELCEPGRPGRAALPALPLASVASYLEALRDQRVIEAADLSADPRLREVTEAAWPGAAAKSIIAAAVRSSGELTGVVSINQLDAARAWHADELSFTAGIADQTAQALLDAQREEALADLRALAGELTRIQDEERRRIGRDLHDSTGQTLVALELDLARLAEHEQALAPAQRAQLEQAVRLAQQCSTEIRTASYLLHPPLLDELGLVSALKWLADGFRQRSGIEVRLELPESLPRLPSEEELALFRVAQEALTNVQRHSASPWVALRLSAGPEGLCLEVQDAGRGISRRDSVRAAGAGAALGVGLAGMRERIRQVGGAFTVESAAGGTTIRAAVPFRPAPAVRSAVR